MKRFLSVLLAALLLSAAFVPAALADDLYGLTIDKLATRTGPGTEYDGGGTYSVQGQYIKVLSRARDKGGIWWVKCEIPYHGEIRVLWTGYKRFDSKTLPLESIPIEGEPTPTITVPPTATPTATPRPTDTPVPVPDWQGAYKQLIATGQYAAYLFNPDPEFNGMLQDRDRTWDSFILYDLDRDGVPELLVWTMFGLEQVDVFTWNGSNAVWVGRIGGDNFFQGFLYYSGYSQPGLVTLLGGPAMEIEFYTVDGVRLVRTEVGRTNVDSEGMETTGITMKLDDPMLYQLLYGTLVSGMDASTFLSDWCTLDDLVYKDDWSLLFR